MLIIILDARGAHDQPAEPGHAPEWPCVYLRTGPVGRERRHHSFEVKVVRLSASEIVWRIARAVGLVAAAFDGSGAQGQ
jgi:hypothetical protein